MIEVQFDDGEVREALQRLSQATGNLAPALNEIGEVLVGSTKHRFETMTAPGGSRWERNSVLSTLLYKDGDRPLTGETGKLADEISYNVNGGDVLEVGSPMEYAAMQQFGGTKSEHPHLWGDIPARPFLGISTDDERKILDILEAHLTRST